MADVIFWRGAEQDLNNLPVEDGQLLYDIASGKMYMDVGEERIILGGEDVVIPVLSVNGKTGKVFLGAKDVGAQPKGDYALKSEIPVVPYRLPNPYKISFKGAVVADYDGTGEVTIDIPADRLPKCNTADNGKFLKVVNGFPKWETILNAKGVAF